MHRLMAGITILEHELSELRLLVERQTGILLDCPNSALAAHVAEYWRGRKWNRPLRCSTACAPPIRIPPRCPAFLDGVLNVNTGFFRHPGAMNALARQVVPQLYARKSDDGPCTLRIWSAGCVNRRRNLLDCDGAVRHVTRWKWERGRPTVRATVNGGRDAKEKARKTARNGGIAENCVHALQGRARETGRFTLSAATCCLRRSKSPNADSIRSRHSRACLPRPSAPASQRSEVRTWLRTVLKTRRRIQVATERPTARGVERTQRVERTLRAMARICWLNRACAAWSPSTP